MTHQNINIPLLLIGYVLKWLYSHSTLNKVFKIRSYPKKTYAVKIAAIIPIKSANRPTPAA